MTANVGAAVTVYQIPISRRSSEMIGHATEEIVIVIAIANEIARGDDRGATIVIATGTGNGINGIVIVIVGTGKIAVVIVRTRIRKKYELKKNLWMVRKLVIT